MEHKNSLASVNISYYIQYSISLDYKTRDPFQKEGFQNTELEPKLRVERWAMFGHQTSNQGGFSSTNSLQASRAAETWGSLE